MNIFAKIGMRLFFRGIGPECSLELQGKIVLVHIAFLVGSFFLIPFGIYAFVGGNNAVGFADLSAGAILLVFYSFSTLKRFVMMRAVAIGLFFVLFLYLTISGGSDASGCMWSFILPLYIIFLVGSAKGTMINIIYLLLVMTFFFIGTPFLSNQYSIAVKLRFCGSFCSLIILATFLESYLSKLREDVYNKNRALESAQRLLEEMASHDNLTGLPNRMLFQDRLQHALESAKRYGLVIGVLFIDLDGFKKINDSLGHDSGDIVLKTVAQKLMKSVRECDTVSRLGGDEFTIILERLTDTSKIADICQRIITEISKPFPIGEIQGYITSSIGISFYPYDGDTMDDLIVKADRAMYEAKNTGKNRFVLFNKANYTTL